MMSFERVFHLVVGWTCIGGVFAGIPGVIFGGVLSVWLIWLSGRK